MVGSSKCDLDTMVCQGRGIWGARVIGMKRHFVKSKGHVWSVALTNFANLSLSCTVIIGTFAIKTVL